VRASAAQGLELEPPSGRHFLLANRAGARLALGDKVAALQDANAAAACGPPSFTTAYIRQVRGFRVQGLGAPSRAPDSAAVARRGTGMPSQCALLWA
jgi:hypothetical protein